MKKWCHAHYVGDRRIEFPQRIYKTKITVPTRLEFHSGNLTKTGVAAIKKGGSVKIMRYKVWYKSDSNNDIKGTQRSKRSFYFVETKG